MDYCPTENIWCDVLNYSNQGAPYKLDFSHFMNISVDYYNKVDHKATHPTILDTKQDVNIKVPPYNWNIPKADPNLVRRSVSHEKKGFGGPTGKKSVTKYLLNNEK